MAEQDTTRSEERIFELTRELEELRAYEEIRRVLFLYARGVDRCDLDLLRDVYHPDATDIHGNAYIGAGRGFADWLVGWASALPFSRHMITNVLVELDGDRAFVESHYDATHRFPLEDGGAVDRIAAGRYLDVFERRDGAWRILHRRTVTDASWSRALSADELTVTVDPQRPPRPGALSSAHAPDDPVYLRFAVADVYADPFQARDPREALREVQARRTTPDTA